MKRSETKSPHPCLPFAIAILAGFGVYTANIIYTIGGLMS
jgi:hypothetical protein